MTKRKTPKDPNRAKHWPTADYKNGYARPPESGKIKPGEVRNPWGPKGKPKPQAIDPFEFAAKQPTKITIDGNIIEVSAEAAAHLVNIKNAIGGDPRAHKNMQEERRSRRGRQPIKDAEEMREDDKHLEQAKEVRQKYVEWLVWAEDMRKIGVLEFIDGKPSVPAWVLTAMHEFECRLTETGEVQ